MTDEQQQELDRLRHKVRFLEALLRVNDHLESFASYQGKRFVEELRKILIENEHMRGELADARKVIQFYAQGDPVIGEEAKEFLVRWSLVRSEFAESREK